MLTSSRCKPTFDKNSQNTDSQFKENQEDDREEVFIDV